MARRKSKAKARRRTKKKVNLIGVTEAIILANVTTQGMFNCGVIEFITGKANPSGGPKGYFPSNTDNLITLPELLGFDQNVNQFSSAAPSYPKPFTSSGAMEKVKENLQTNGLMMAAQLILIPVGFTAVTKVTRKPRATANKLLDYTGLGVKV